jgi:uncharacterized protein (DUF3820 family)
MTDDAPKIIPFGKYRGRLLDEVLADDPAYLQWLAGQDWFRAKFNILHQVIINRGAEPEETPDHNAMQVKFLDDDFCLRFLNAVKPNYAADVCSKFNSVRTTNLKLVESKFIEQKVDAPKKADEALVDASKRIEEMTQYYRTQRDGRAIHPDPDAYRAHETERAKRKHETERVNQGKRLKLLSGMRSRLVQPITTVEFFVTRRFEVGGVDVYLKVAARDVEWRFEYECSESTGYPLDYYWRNDWREWRSVVGWQTEHNIEIKPVIGDDYPAVLRQMKRTGADVLFVGEYTGQGATEEQFVQTMATAGIRVVFAREVEG